MHRQTYLVQNPKYLVIHLVRFDDTFDQYGKLRVVKNHEEVLIDHTLSLTPFTRSAQTQISDYDLYGIVHHSGSLSGGHYVSEVKIGDGRWYRCNDSSITQILQPGERSTSAYVLFY